VTGLVRRPVFALAVSVAVACSVTRALLESRHQGAAAGAMGALVQLEPQVGVGGVSWHKSTFDTTLAVDAGVHGLVFLHAHAQAQKDLFEQLIAHAVATATHTLVRYDILIWSVFDDVVAAVDEGVDLLVLAEVGIHYGSGDFFVDVHVLAVCVIRQDSEWHTRYSVDGVTGTNKPGSSLPPQRPLYLSQTRTAERCS
jgi:hypothetical protein